MKKNQPVNSYNQFDPEIEAKVDAMMSMEPPDNSNNDHIQEKHKPIRPIISDKSSSADFSNALEKDNQSTGILKTNDLKETNSVKEDSDDQLTNNQKENILVIDDDSPDQMIPVKIDQQSFLSDPVVSNSPKEMIEKDELTIDDKLIEEIEKTEADDLLALEDKLEDDLNQSASQKSHKKLIVIISSLIVIILIVIYWLYIRGKKW